MKGFLQFLIMLGCVVCHTMLGMPYLALCGPLLLCLCLEISRQNDKAARRAAQQPHTLQLPLQSPIAGAPAPAAGSSALTSSAKPFFVRVATPGGEVLPEWKSMLLIAM